MADTKLCTFTEHTYEKFIYTEHWKTHCYKMKKQHSKQDRTQFSEIYFVNDYIYEVDSDCGFS